MNIFLDALKNIYGTGLNAFNKFGDVVGGGLYDYIHRDEKPLKVMPQAQAQVPSPTPTVVPQPTQAPTQMPVAPPTYPSPTPPPIAVNQTLPPDRLNFLENYLLPETRALGLPDALVAAQWAQEGGRVEDNSIHNLFGLGPNIPYPSREQGIKAYAQTVNKLANDNQVPLPENPNAYDYLMAIQNPQGQRYEVSPGNPYDYTQKVMNTPEWRYYFK